MALDLEEQEQIDQLKAVWGKYGNLVTWVLIIALAGYAGWTYWNNNQSSHASQAAGLYNTMETALQAKDNTKAQNAAADIRKDYGNTVYAQFSALASAKMAPDAKTAKTELQWVIDSKYNDEFVAIARIRLAGILLDEKAYDDAMKQLSGEMPAKFEALVADRKGDILAAQNKLDEARAMYKSALDKTDEKSPAHNMIELKLESVGGAADESAAKKAA